MKNIILLVIMVIFFRSCVNYFYPAKLINLNKDREVAFQKIRPSFLKYKVDKGVFPGSIDDLVPDYAEEIPGVLLPHGENEGVFELTYVCSGDKAFFVYHTTRGPDSRKEYYIDTGRFVADN